MHESTINHALLFSIEDVEDVCSAVTEWAESHIDHLELPRGLNEDREAALTTPRFSKCAVLSALRAMLDEAIVKTM